MTDADAHSGSAKSAPSLTWWQRRSRWVWLTVRLVLAATVLGAGVWWFLLAPVSVTTHTVERGDVSAEVLGTGTLEARVSATIGPKVAGLITRITADQGDRVNTGDTLVFLEDTDFKQQVGVAEADMAAAKASMDRFRAGQRRAEAVLVRAKEDHKRISELVASGAATRDEHRNAVALLSIAEAESSSAAAVIVEGEKRLTAAECSLDYQRARLHDTTIKAPFDGLVVRRDRDAGDVLTAGSSVLQLVSLKEMWIAAWVDETELARLAEGQAARVVFRSEPNTEYSGVVARVGREADRETREILVDVRVERLPDNWAVGQRAEVFIGVGRKEDVTILPSALILLRDSRTGVMVDDGGSARWREITVGLRGRDFVEVSGGLSPGEVVVSPADGRTGPLRDGRRIHTK